MMPASWRTASYVLSCAEHPVCHPAALPGICRSVAPPLQHASPKFKWTGGAIHYLSRTSVLCQHGGSGWSSWALAQSPSFSLSFSHRVLRYAEQHTDYKPVTAQSVMILSLPPFPPRWLRQVGVAIPVCGVAVTGVHSSTQVRWPWGRRGCCISWDCVLVSPRCVTRWLLRCVCFQQHVFLARKITLLFWLADVFGSRPLQLEWVFGYH